MPLVIGLILLLMVAVVSINELVISSLRAASQIEASDKAFFAAEAGIEDALYELSPHFAGYETPDLNTTNVRKVDYTENVRWNSKWTIRSHPDRLTNRITGNFGENQKLILSYFNDTSGGVPPAYIGTDPNAINTAPSNIQKLTFFYFTLAIKVPSFVPGNELHIDNDGDLLNSTAEGEEGINGLNEDGPGDEGYCPSSPNTPISDRDCDGQNDEDSIYDPVVYWKITDETGRSLVPIRGCLHDDGTEICEKDFINKIVQLNHGTHGVDNTGAEKSIMDFISDPDGGNKIQIELTIVAPLQQVDLTTTRKIKIPYLEYDFSTTGITNKPLPYFTIKSDGYYRDYKQSITTTVTPKTAVPLFDFTIIQQQ
jgi:hypothetical protein